METLRKNVNGVLDKIEVIYNKASKLITYLFVGIIIPFICLLIVWKINISIGKDAITGQTDVTLALTLTILVVIHMVGAIKEYLEG